MLTRFVFILYLVLDYTLGQILVHSIKTDEERISDLLGISATSLTKLPRLIDYFDKINVDRQLNNKEFVDAQIKCLVYDGPCGIFGRRAKALLPAVILDNCRLCSSEQKNKLSRVVVHLQQNYPGAWRDALVKYGGAPKFITAGHVAPQTNLFGSNNHHQHNRHFHPTPTSQAHGNLVLNGVHFQVPTTSSTSTLMIPIMLYSPSSPPEPIPAMESPSSSINFEPTVSPYGDETSSSSQTPSTPVVESTLDFKPTTLQSSYLE